MPAQPVREGWRTFDRGIIANQQILRSSSTNESEHPRNRTVTVVIRAAPCFFAQILIQGYRLDGPMANRPKPSRRFP